MHPTLRMIIKKLMASKRVSDTRELTNGDLPNKGVQKL